MYLDHITMRITKMDQRRSLLRMLKRECRTAKPRELGFTCSVYRNRVFHLITTSNAIVKAVRG